jgi:hypothetical protein
VSANGTQWVSAADARSVMRYASATRDSSGHAPNSLPAPAGMGNARVAIPLRLGTAIFRNDELGGHQVPLYLPYAANVARPRPRRHTPTGVQSRATYQGIASSQANSAVMIAALETILLPTFISFRR